MPNSAGLVPSCTAGGRKTRNGLLIPFRMSQIVMKRLAAWPVNRRKALGAGVAVCGIGVGGYIALRYVSGVNCLSR